MSSSRHAASWTTDSISGAPMDLGTGVTTLIQCEPGAA
jgi:hypothetical protein